MRLRTAFTLIELLVVIAIISIVAAILFPVLSRARAAARASVCASNFREMGQAVLLYAQDYDERLPITTNGFISCAVPGDLLQILLDPYAKTDALWLCPEDTASRQRREANLCDDASPPANRTIARQDFAWHADFAYNQQYFAPAAYGCPDYPNYQVVAVATPTLAEVARPAESIYATDSVWNRLADGTPEGGGTGFVDPPCRYLPDGTDTFPDVRPCEGNGGYGGWLPSKPLDWQVYGGVWPRHARFATVFWLDGHVKAKTIDALTAGCDVKDNWGGFITDLDKYLWDRE